MPALLTVTNGIASGHEAYDSELDNIDYQSQLVIDPTKAAIVCIDVWQSHPNDGWLARAQANIEDSLAPLLIAARAKGMKVAHAPTGYTINTYPGVAIQGVDQAIDDPDVLASWLIGQGVETVFFCGYATNICMISKPCSPYHMRPKLPGMQLIALEDCTIGMERPWSYEGEYLKRAALDFVRYHVGPTATNADFFQMLSGA